MSDSDYTSDPTRYLAGPKPRPDRGTLNHLFYESAEHYDKPDALNYKEGGHYRPISHRELIDRVRRVGQGLLQKGLRPGDRVAILSENRPEWAITDYACLSAGLVDVPIYASLPAKEVQPMLVDSGVVAVCVSTAAQAAKIDSVRKTVPAIRLVISFDPGPIPGADLSFQDLEEAGTSADTADSARQYRERALGISPDELATVIYTSGTTGEPKGVMLTHDNIYSNVMAAKAVLPFYGHEVSLCFLPLSHIFGRMADHYLMFAVGASINYVESIDSLLTNLSEVHPTFVLAVPRVYEKIYAGVIEQAHKSEITRRLFEWCKAVGGRSADVRLAGGRPDPWLALQYRVADLIVFRRLRDRLGGRLRFFVSGGAPLSPEINRFLYSAGLTVLEGYGLTETSPVICVNTPTKYRIGTVGGPPAGIEVRIAEDGEILARGPNVMRGYLNKPAETREVIEPDGWFHTGDIGELNDGFLKITDRKKDLIVTAGGKKVAPAPIENLLRSSPFVGQVVMIGDRRKFPSLLVVPNYQQLERWATEQGLTWPDRASLNSLPVVEKKMEDETLGRLTGLASFETPKRIALLDKELSFEGGELSPLGKPKRKVIDRMYADVIDRLYPSEG
jgi:long-chain acyl-CoA synthetase